MTFRAHLVALLLATAGLVALAWHLRPSEAPAPPPGASLASLRDSLTHARVLDSVRLHAWADSVVALRGDSLRAAFGRRAASLRPRVVHLPGSVDTVRDTVEVAGADLRTVLLSDSLCWDSVASLRGRIRLDSARLDSARTAPRPTCPRPWGWFAAGVATGLGACLMR